MSGWKARIGYLSPSVFESPSDWDLILPKGFTIVASGLNVQAHTDAEFNKAIDALAAGLGIFTAEECDAVLMGGITLGTLRGYAAEQQIMRPTMVGAQKRIVEYEPPIAPIRFLVYDSVVVLSGVTTVLPTLAEQFDNIFPRITGSLADAGTACGNPIWRYQ